MVYTLSALYRLSLVWLPSSMCVHLVVAPCGSWKVCVHRDRARKRRVALDFRVHAVVPVARRLGA